MINRILASTPVNATAARVTSGGIHWESQRKQTKNPEWDAPPPVFTTRQIKALTNHPSRSFVDLTGRVFGRLTVIGFLGSPNPKKGGAGLSGAPVANMNNAQPRRLQTLPMRTTSVGLVNILKV